MQILLKILLNGMAVFIAAYVLPGVAVDTFLTALIVGIVLGVINAFLRPLLFLLTLPINVLTLGLFTFVINGFLVLLTAALVAGFSVENFLWAIAFSLVITLVSWFLSSLKKQ